MIRISQLKLGVGHTEEALRAKICKLLRIKEDSLLSYTRKKQSLDARKKPQLFYVYTIDVKVKNENEVKKHIRRQKNSNILFLPDEKKYALGASGTRPLAHRPVVIGTGPAGLFCGYELARLGYRPILLERGASVEDRLKDVEEFWNTGVLNPHSNVQFGEGGAGTFSDGKLNTLVHDPLGRNVHVLEIFVENGAPEEILYQSKPHIGTDILANVVRNMREYIISHGGEVRFHSQVTDLVSTEDEGIRKLTGLKVRTRQNTEKVLDTEIAVLAIGHSARDTFLMLKDCKISMEAKAFAVGIRMEHPQSMIDHAQYGTECGSDLPAAAYKLTANLPDGRGVYTFCMCPGGYVVNASSESCRLAVNGMSYHARDGINANSAVVVTVTPKDYPVNDGASGALAGMEFQRRLEEAAYREGRGKIPVQLFEDFCKNCPSEGPGGFLPQTKGSYDWGNVRAIFPEELAEALEEGIRSFGKRLKGYDRPDALVSGVESRTSSPVKILRDETMQSSISGVYPCGEGAGYAGGITSAAMDGVKIAEAIIKEYRA
ncbi:MAG: FAD-dependent oxidoreductase [Dorea sp.]|jgi:uncharacterized FAD-dependent dehydrogenase|nr:FAD-dependent oxidoreductase [Dorea sp.]